MSRSNEVATSESSQSCCSRGSRVVRLMNSMPWTKNAAATAPRARRGNGAVRGAPTTRGS
jgi:hypothetical protein